MSKKAQPLAGNKKMLVSRKSSFTINKDAPLQTKKIPASTVKKSKKGVLITKESSTTKEKPVYDKAVTCNFNSMIQGDLSEVPSMPKTMVRIFLSSTFSDMRNERNILAREAYPQLRDYCTSLDLDFQVVDMRWGITDDCQNDHSVEALCLTEVANCQNQSKGTNFIVLSGNRYGFRPIPTELSLKMFDILLSAARKLNLPNIPVFEEWYRLDKNATPNKYILQTIRSKFSFYADFSPGCDEHRKAHEKLWNETFSMLQAVVRSAATQAHKDGQITEEDKHTFFMSVTESEIQAGILQAENVDEHCLVYRRNFTELSSIVFGEGLRFIDCIQGEEGKVVDTMTQDLRESLYQNILAKLSTSNIRSYNLSWGHKGLDPDAHQEDKQYLEAFCHDFIADCKAMIDKAGVKQTIAVNMANYYSDYTETVHHLKFCLKKCQTFFGQEMVLNKAKEYILQEKAKFPLIIHAESGLGKTSIMAMIMKSIPEWLDNQEHFKIIRFLGTTPKSVHIEEVLFNVLGTMADAFDLIIPPINYVNFKALQDYAPRFLRQVSTTAKCPVVILLDSVDQLGPECNAYAMKWLPTLLPPWIKIIVSTLPRKKNILKNIKDQIPNADCYVKVPDLPLEAGKKITELILAAKNRTITDEQMQLVMSKFKGEPSPLFLKLLIDQAQKWNSFTKLDDIDLADSVKAAINKLFEKLEKKFGLSLIRHALGYITFGMHGLTEFEIEDVLSCDDIVLNDVYQYHDPPIPGILRIPPLLWARIYQDIKEYLTEKLAHGKNVLNWYHRQFYETSTERFSEKGQETLLHKNLTEIHLQEDGVRRTITLKNRKGMVVENADRQIKPQPCVVTNLRKLACLPYHAIRGFDLLGKEMVKTKILCNFKFICTRIAAFRIPAILGDLDDFLKRTEDDEVEILRYFISNSKENLTLPVRFAYCLVVGLNPTESQKSLQNLVSDAKNFLLSQNRPLLIPTFPSLANRQGSSAAMMLSVQEISDILAQSNNLVLLMNQDGKDSTCSAEDEKPPYSILRMDRQEMTSVDMPKMSQDFNLIGEFYMNDNRIFYTTDKALSACRKKETPIECSYQNVVQQKGKDQPMKVMDFTTNYEVSNGAVTFDTFVLLVDLQKMKFGSQLVVDKPNAKIKTCLITNETEVVAMGTCFGKPVAETTFICRIPVGETKPESIVETEKKLNFGLKTFANQERTVFVVAKDGSEATQVKSDDGKNSAEENSSVLQYRCDGTLSEEVVIDGAVTKIVGNPETAEALALTTKGVLVVITGDEKFEIKLAQTAVDFAPLWDDCIVFIGTVSGNVTTYNLSTKTNMGAFTASSFPIKSIGTSGQTCVTLTGNSELKSWSVPMILQDFKQKQSVNSNKNSSSCTLIDQANVSAIGLSHTQEELFTCTQDGFLYLWDYTTLELIKKFNIDLVVDTLHALKVNIAIHDTSAGKMKFLNPYTGQSVFTLPESTQNIMHSTLNPACTKLLLFSAPKPGKEHVDVIDVEKLVVLKSIPLQTKLSYENVELSWSLNEQFAILKSKISEAEYSSIAQKWKTGGFNPQPHRHKFHAIDLSQGTGALIPCYRQLSKIPTLGVNVVPGGKNSMIISARRYTVFWDIPTGKCDQKNNREVKEPMFYRPTWLGQTCKGANSCMVHCVDHNFLAVGSEDGYMFVYEYTSGLPPNRKKPASKHNGKVNKIAVSPDGKWVASACTSNQLKIWDSSTVTEQFSVKLSANAASMMFDRSSKKLVLYAGTQNTRVLIFDVHTGTKGK